MYGVIPAIMHVSLFVSFIRTLLCTLASNNKVQSEILTSMILVPELFFFFLSSHASSDALSAPHQLHMAHARQRPRRSQFLERT